MIKINGINNLDFIFPIPARVTRLPFAEWEWGHLIEFGSVKVRKGEEKLPIEIVYFVVV
jgi:hypothetical protein